MEFFVRFFCSCRLMFFVEGQRLENICPGKIRHDFLQEFPFRSFLVPTFLINGRFLSPGFSDFSSPFSHVRKLEQVCLKIFSSAVVFYISNKSHNVTSSVLEIGTNFNAYYQPLKGIAPLKKICVYMYI